LDGGRKKGGIKVHAMMDAFSGVTEFVRMTEAREHDRNFLYHLKVPAGSWLVFDKAFNVYHQFANMITVIRLHLMSYVELLEFIKDRYKAWRKTYNTSFAFAT